MKGRSLSTRIIGSLCALALLATACSAAPSTPTVTVSNNVCTYAGPSQVAPKFGLSMNIKDASAAPEYVFVFARLMPGKSLADARALKSYSPDAKSDTLDNMALVGALKSGISSQEVDLTANAAYHGEPLYLICLDHAYAVLNVLGPINVKQ